MSVFNIKKEPSTTTLPTKINDMGELAYQLAYKEELVATCLTTFLRNSYYEKQNDVLNRILNAIKKVDPLFTAKLAIYLRDKTNMRTTSHVLAGEISSLISQSDYAKRFYEKIVVRLDDMTEIIGYIVSKRTIEPCDERERKKIKIAPLPNALKKGFREAFKHFDAYQIDKYKMEKRSIKLVDLINIIRPVPSKKNAEALSCLIKQKSLKGLYKSRILEVEMSKSKAVAEEQNISIEEAKKIAIENVLNNVSGMPIFNLIRNLRNIIINAPDSVDEACNQLTVKEKVLNSRLLPFRFATAYTEIEQMQLKDSSSSVTFESEVITKENFEKLKIKVLDALETALEYSVLNIPNFEGNTAILIDHSGSVRGDCGGSSKVAPFSSVTTAMIGNLFGSMLAFSQDNVYIGLFGDKLIPIPMNRKSKVLEFNKMSFDAGDKCGRSTEQGLYIFLQEAIKSKKKIDNLVIFSDMVIGSKGEGAWDNTSRVEKGCFQDLFLKFRGLNPKCHTVCVDIRQTNGTSVFNRSLNVTQIAGWSDKIFDIISANALGYTALIEEIEKIVI